MIGIVIPTFERPPFQTMTNLQSQIFNDWVAVIVTQSDPWGEIPLPNNSGRTIEINCSLPGTNMARNLGMSVAMDLGCDRICFWDDDDIFDADYLEAMSGALDDYPTLYVSACITRHEGRNLAITNGHTSSRMVRADAIKDRRWDRDGKLGQDQRWWAQFRHLRQAYVQRSLYETGNAKVGGYRHAEAAC